MSVRAPREALSQVVFETRVFKHAIEWLRKKDELSAADKLEAEFVRLAVRRGSECPCELTQIVGPCTAWTADKSGGFCRRCAHHKDCHRGVPGGAA